MDTDRDIDRRYWQKLRELLRRILGPKKRNHTEFEKEAARAIHNVESIIDEIRNQASCESPFRLQPPSESSSDYSVSLHTPVEATEIGSSNSTPLPIECCSDDKDCSAYQSPQDKPQSNTVTGIDNEGNHSCTTLPIKGISDDKECSSCQDEPAQNNITIINEGSNHNSTMHPNNSTSVDKDCSTHQSPEVETQNNVGSDNEGSNHSCTMPPKRNSSDDQSPQDELAQNNIVGIDNESSDYSCPPIKSCSDDKDFSACQYPQDKPQENKRINNAGNGQTCTILPILNDKTIASQSLQDKPQVDTEMVNEDSNNMESCTTPNIQSTGNSDDKDLTISQPSQDMPQEDTGMENEDSNYSYSTILQSQHTPLASMSEVLASQVGYN